MPQMKPTVQDEDMEDDLAAEEENKLINEVSQPPPPKSFALRTNHFQEYKIWYMILLSRGGSSFKP